MWFFEEGTWPYVIALFSFAVFQLTVAVVAASHVILTKREVRAVIG